MAIAGEDTSSIIYLSFSTVYSPLIALQYTQIKDSALASEQSAIKSLLQWEGSTNAVGHARGLNKPANFT